MEVNLIHHGYNPERRKMYPSNPRNNLVSTVDIVWQKSLQNQYQYANYQPKIKKQEELIDIKQNYTRAVEAQIEEEARINKSSFRVMPVHPIESIHYNSMSKTAMRDSLNQQLNSFREKNKAPTSPIQINKQQDGYRSQIARNHLIDESNRKPKPIQNSSNVSSTIFGYNINYDTFKRQSYLSKLLSDRLQPYINKSVDGRMPKHSSFTINTPVPNYYQ